MKRSAICSRSTAGRDCRGRDGPGQVEFSLERVVKRNGPPAFIVMQFGWNADNVDELVEVVDRRHVRIEMVEEFSPGLVLHVLSAGMGSVVDRELVLSHEQEGDQGAGWLQSNSAGSGQFRLRSWQTNESVVLEANPGYRHGALGVQRVVLRHIPEPAEQWLLLERGEVDVARDLTPDLIAVPGRQRGGRGRQPSARHGDLPGSERRPPDTGQPAGGARTAPRGRLSRHGGYLPCRPVCGAPGVLAARTVGLVQCHALPPGPCARQGATRLGGLRRWFRGAPRNAHQSTVPGDRVRRGRHACGDRHRSQDRDDGRHHALVPLSCTPAFDQTWYRTVTKR